MNPARLLKMLKSLTHRPSLDVIPAHPEGLLELNDYDMRTFGVWEARGGYQLITQCACGQSGCTGCDLGS
jgi:hypothetical protein